MAKKKTATKYPQLHGNDRISVIQKHAKRQPGGAFASLTFEQRKVAEAWLWKFCKKWGNDLPPWRRGILTGVAKRLATEPPNYNRNKNMRSVHAGRCAQRKHRANGVDTAALMLAARVRKQSPVAHSFPNIQLPLN